MNFKFLFSTVLTVFLMAFAACQIDQPPSELRDALIEQPYTVNYDGEVERAWSFFDNGTLKVSPVINPEQGFHEVYSWEQIGTNLIRLQLTGMEYQGEYTKDKVSCCFYQLEVKQAQDGALDAILKPESGQYWTYLTFKRE